MRLRHVVVDSVSDGDQQGGGDGVEAGEEDDEVHAKTVGKHRGSQGCTLIPLDAGQPSRGERWRKRDMEMKEEGRRRRMDDVAHTKQHPYGKKDCTH